MKSNFRVSVSCAAALLVLLQFSAYAQTASAETELVEKFLTISSLKKLDKPTRKTMISPAFYTSLGDKAAKAEVNMYVPDGYHIESDSSGYVSALIWGPYRAWAHRLVFKVERQNDKHYIVPLAGAQLSNLGFFDPWIRVEKNINKQLLPPKER